MRSYSSPQKEAYLLINQIKNARFKRYALKNTSHLNLRLIAPSDSEDGRFFPGNIEKWLHSNKSFDHTTVDFATQSLPLGQEEIGSNQSIACHCCSFLTGVLPYQLFPGNRNKYWICTF